MPQLRDAGTGMFRRSYLFEILSYAVVIAALLIIGWRRWADPWMDFGREVLIARRISEGGLFGRDILHLFGPLSGHLNGAVFRIAGPSLSTLFALNIAILLAVLGISRRIFGIIASRGAAVAATLVSLPVFFLGHLGPIGSFNYVAPYSHELVHGYLFALLSLALAHEALQRERARWALLGGCAMGALLLTKYEVVLAGFGGVALLGAASPRRGSGRLWGALAAGIAIVPAIFFVRYSAALGPACAADALFGNVRLLSGAWTSSYFYLSGIGLDKPVENLLGMITRSLGLLLVLFLLYSAGRVHRRFLGERRSSVLSAAFFLLFLLLGLKRLPMLDLARVLPIAAGLVLFRSFRSWSQTTDARWRLASGYALFSLLLLSKMILNPRFFQYGFVLAAPATACLILALLDWVPRAVREREPVSARAIRAGIAGVLAALMVKCAVFSWDGFRSQDQPIGYGPNRFFVCSEGNPKGNFVLAHDLVRKHVPPEASLAVLPEGGLLNQATGRRSPLSLPTLMPAEFLLFGEERVFEEVVQSSPDYILINNRFTPEYRMIGFGFDFGTRLMKWIQSEYYPVDGYGTVPLEIGKQGGVLLKRRASAGRGEPGAHEPGGKP
ncbi:MAG: hypothetical protein ABIH26_11870 [Candidatus Eisenbacteria bacterium]